MYQVDDDWTPPRCDYCRSFSVDDSKLSETFPKMFYHEEDFL